MKSIAHIFSKYSVLVWAALKPLGGWGVFAIAGIDGVGIPLPGAVDAVVATYVYSNPRLAWLYVIAATVGSALGCLVLYFIGYEGGEVFLRKRMNPEKFERTRQSFEDHPLLALMFPAMLPPPFPFKVFVFSAAVFEMKVREFLFAIVAGRLIRFTLLAALTIKFGPNIVTFTSTVVRRHIGVALLIIGCAIAATLIAHRLRRGAASPAVDGTR